jgi:hypothetical protein
MTARLEVDFMRRLKMHGGRRLTLHLLRMSCENLNIVSTYTRSSAVCYLAISCQSEDNRLTSVCLMEV